MLHKVVLAGMSAAGKTALFKRLTKNHWDDIQQATVQASFDQKTVNYKDKQIHINYWDTAGQEQFKSISILYFRNTAIALLVFDLTNDQSLNDINYWVGQVTQKSESKAAMFLVGTKMDICQEENLDKINELVELYNMKFFKTSSFTGAGITELQEQIVAYCYDREHTNMPTKLDLPRQPLPKKQTGCC